MLTHIDSQVCSHDYAAIGSAIEHSMCLVELAQFSKTHNRSCDPHMAALARYADATLAAKKYRLAGCVAWATLQEAKAERIYRTIDAAYRW